MSNGIKTGSKVFIALSRTHAKIWENEFEPHSKPISIVEPSSDHKYNKVVDQFLDGRTKYKLDPHYAEKISAHLVGIDKIYLVGGGKGKASAMKNFVTFLEERHPEISSHVHQTLDIDEENFSDPEMLALARKMSEKDI